MANTSATSPGTMANDNGLTVASYYFDASDVESTDPDGVWTNDYNAFDESAGVLTLA